MVADIPNITWAREILSLSSGFPRSKNNPTIKNLRILQKKTFLGTVIKKHVKFEVAGINGSMVSDIPKLACQALEER